MGIIAPTCGRYGLTADIETLQDVSGDRSKFTGDFSISTDDRASVEDRGGYMIGYSYFAGSEQDFAGIPPEAWRRPDQRRTATRRILDVIAGRTPGRVNTEDVMHLSGGGYTSVGFAALAGLVYRNAKERGLGQQLPLEWFVQKIRD